MHVTLQVPPLWSKSWLASLRTPGVLTLQGSLSRGSLSLCPGPFIV